MNVFFHFILLWGFSVAGGVTDSYINNRNFCQEKFSAKKLVEIYLTKSLKFLIIGLKHTINPGKSAENG